jgi:hypothetical protein
MPAIECRHILASGQKCHAPALKNHPWCYFHNQHRTDKRTRDRAAAEAGSPKPAFILPTLEDHPSIQVAFAMTAQALLDGTIDNPTARALGFLLRGATANLAAHRATAQAATQNAKDPSPVIVADHVDTIVAPDPVTEITLADGEPAGPIEYAPEPPCDCILSKSCGYACKCQCHEPAPESAPARAASTESHQPAPRQRARTLNDYIREQCEIHEEELKSQPRLPEIHETYKSCPSWYSAQEKEEWARSHPPTSL